MVLRRKYGPFLPVSAFEKHSSTKEDVLGPRRQTTATRRSISLISDQPNVAHYRWGAIKSVITSLPVASRLVLEEVSQRLVSDIVETVRPSERLMAPHILKKNRARTLHDTRHGPRQRMTSGVKSSHLNHKLFRARSLAIFTGRSIGSRLCCVVVVKKGDKCSCNLLPIYMKIVFSRIYRLFIDEKSLFLDWIVNKKEKKR